MFSRFFSRLNAASRLLANLKHLNKVGMTTGGFVLSYFLEANFVFERVGLRKNRMTQIKSTLDDEHNNLQPLKLSYYPSRINSKNLNGQLTDITFNQDGICYGATLLWFIYLQTGRNFLSETNYIHFLLSQDKTLDAHQLKLLNDISIIQDLQKLNSLWQINPITYLKISNTIAEPKQVDPQYFTHIVKEAIDNPEKLFGIIVHIGDKAHIIGLTTSASFKIKCFDVNLGEFTFSAPEEAIAKLESMAHQYAKSSSNTLIVQELQYEIKTTLFPGFFSSKRPIIADQDPQNQLTRYCNS